MALHDHNNEVDNPFDPNTIPVLKNKFQPLGYLDAYLAELVTRQILQRGTEAIKVKAENFLSAAISGCSWNNETAL